MNKLDSLLHDAVRTQDKALLEDATRHPHHFSARHNRALRRMFHPNTGRRRHTRRLLAAVLAAILLFGSVTATAFWSELESFFRVNFSRFTGLQSTPPVQPNQDFYDLPEDWGAVWLPLQLPEGYTFYCTSMQNHVKKIQYISETGDILIFSQSGKTSFKFEDSEGTLIHNLYVGSFAAYAWEKSRSEHTINNLVWTTENNTFTLVGTLPLNDLIAIGETLQLTEIGE